MKCELALHIHLRKDGWIYILFSIPPKMGEKHEIGLAGATKTTTRHNQDRAESRQGAALCTTHNQAPANGHMENSPVKQEGWENASRVGKKKRREKRSVTCRCALHDPSISKNRERGGRANEILADMAHTQRYLSLSLNALNWIGTDVTFSRQKKK